MNPGAADATRRRLTASATRRIVDDLVAQHRLDLKVVAIETVEADPEHGRVTRVFYTAPARVDFRALVADLARALRGRVDLRQLNDRELAARLGGIGVCGQSLCCATWLSRPRPVPATLVRDLPVAHDPDRLVGCCGRLMCCLRFESRPSGSSEARPAGPTPPTRPRQCPRATQTSGNRHG